MTQQDLLQAASQLNEQELKEFIAQITVIYQQRQTKQGLEDAQLVAVVQRSLPSQIQQRWDELIAKRDETLLTPTEYDELLQLTEQVEDFNVQRLEALSQLAQTRGVDLRTIMRQLNLPEPSYG
jgi:phosphotransacetylase